jgi:hypothetical protein
VFWNEEEDCGNDTELGTELYEYIRNSLEDKSDVIIKTLMNILVLLLMMNLIIMQNSSRKI